MGLLTALGGKLAERWLSLLVVPGVMFVFTAVAGGHVLTHRHWKDVGRLRDHVDAVAADPAARSPGVIVLVAVAVLIGSAVAGLAAQGCGRVVAWLWMGTWGPPARPLARWRHGRWSRAADRYDRALAEKARRLVHPDGGEPRAPLPDTVTLAAARNRIGLAEPRRPTWMGDRMLAVETRVRDAYDLDLASAWPRLWLLLSEEARAPITQAQNAFTGAARTAGWGTLYLAVGLWWWPALLIGTATWATAWSKGRSATETLAQLAEATVDLHTRDLAAALGIEVPAQAGHDVGESITRAVRKSS
jgi:hypothetical protein